MFVTVIALKYALLVSQWSYGHFLKPTDSVLFEQRDKSSTFNSTNFIVLYPQNGDRIVTLWRHFTPCIPGTQFRQATERFSARYLVGRLSRACLPLACGSTQRNGFSGCRAAGRTNPNRNSTFLGWKYTKCLGSRISLGAFYGSFQILCNVD